MRETKILTISIRHRCATETAVATNGSGSSSNSSSSSSSNNSDDEWYTMMMVIQMCDGIDDVTWCGE
ncbi:hypothetical protein T08_11591 [Trichinella sp. T8]|nr:hypothetical protein T08_11591 [Trichinella sp. T8]